MYTLQLTSFDNRHNDCFRFRSNVGDCNDDPHNNLLHAFRINGLLHIRPSTNWFFVDDLSDLDVFQGLRPVGWLEDHSSLENVILQKTSIDAHFDD